MVLSCRGSVGKNKRARESDESTRGRGDLMRAIQVREKILKYWDTKL